MRLVLAALVLAVVSATALAAAPDSGARGDFDALVARVRKSDPDVDFDRLRRLYVRLDSYTGSTTSPKAMFAALDKEDYKTARSLADAALAEDYLDVDAQMVAAVACDALGDAEGSRRHEYVVRGILQAITSSGDGSSREKAMFVVTVAEEYATARTLGYRVTGQRLDHSGDHTYDVLSVVDEAGKSLDLYFDIDAIWAAEQRVFGR